MACLPALAQTVGGLTNMSFGSFLAGSGGTVTVSTSGLRMSSGGVIIVGQGQGVSAAQITVHGTAYAMYSISLPVDSTATLSDGNSHTIGLNAFVSNPSGTGTLSPGGIQVVNIGATLVVSNALPPGAYNGSFAVTVNYQ